MCIDYIGKFYYVNRFHSDSGSVEYLSLPTAPIHMDSSVNAGSNFLFRGLNYNPDVSKFV